MRNISLQQQRRSQRHAQGEYHHYDDERLLSLSREGDTTAFGELWQRHRLPALTAARSLAPTLDEDDLVSQAYLKVFELVKAGRGPTGAFRPYLYRVIQSIAADTYRSKEQTVDDLEQIAGLSEAGPWQDNAFDLNAASTAFQSLPERWQQVLWYTEVEGMPPREVATLLGMSANAVSALNVRARESLQSAWVETHVNMSLADAECEPTLRHLQRFQRGKLTAKRSREVAAHLDICDRCEDAARECATLNSQLALTLATLCIGSVGASALLQQFSASAAFASVGGSVGGSVGVGSASAAASTTTALSIAATVVGATVIGGVALAITTFAEQPRAHGEATHVSSQKTSAEVTPQERTTNDSANESETASSASSTSSPLASNNNHTSTDELSHTSSHTSNNASPGTTASASPEQTSANQMQHTGQQSGQQSGQQAQQPSGQHANSQASSTTEPIWNCFSPADLTASSTIFAKGSTLPNGDVATMATRWPNVTDPATVIC